ncbi:Ion transport protein-domain-containing protein [Hygrophoropsis aurantiaca]|uniref:Ion transport protein-domain-containing protein n=1 Tax=Hygrophoropsis aurantiaca TaxID=72124 RepID=A0ACB8A6T7_9AGAM|nr:Ion transport protein-domain-containing protein [Hygrophoropsis aurantiaca]
MGTDTSWNHNLSVDSERIGGTTPRSKRRTLRYSASPSPLERTSTAIKAVSRNLRRASLRVVNMAGTGLDHSIRLPDDDHEDGKMEEDTDDNLRLQHDLMDLRKPSPLRGRTLGFLDSSNSFRLYLYRILVHSWTEPLILMLIIVNAIVLTIQASHSLLLPPSGTPIPHKGYFYRWEDYILFILFVIFTLEAIARSCVSGFLFDPDVAMSSIFTFSFAMPSPSASDYTTAATSSTSTLHDSNPTSSQPTFFSRAFRSDRSPDDKISLPFRLNVTSLQDKVQRNLPYLRQSWGRIDFVAIVGFWVSFALAMTGIERGTYHVGSFRALSVLRTARLLAITSGTTTIMRSLKIARPLLASVAYFVLFAIVLFSIIGVQSFKGSFRRTCTLLSTQGEQPTTLNQFCGGYINATTLQVAPYLLADGSVGDTAKGYICPIGQICQEGQNPNQGVQSFDTVYYAALQVIVIASANTWSPIMYSIIDAEFFVSCFFFIACIVVLNFWLFNLFVAVITNTFSAIRSDTKKSAFGAAPLGPIVEEQEEGWNAVNGRHVSHSNRLKVFYEYTRWCWVFLALAGLAVQATTTVNMSELHQTILDNAELAITFAFDIEIIIRVFAELPDWRRFFEHTHNWLDLLLAVASSIIQIPAIRHSSVYPWLTIFQLARFYRVILEFPRMKPLMLTVFGNMYGLVNMTLFLMLFNFLAALIGVQLLRGDMDGSQVMNFGQLFNSFLAVYQLFSSENWTTVLYDAADAEIPLGQAVVAVIFLSAWLLFANFIVMQMFIAVINENFNVAEETKKGKQASDYWARHQHQHVSHGAWLRKLNPYRWLRANPVRVKVDNLPSNLVLPMQKTLVQDYEIPAQNRKSPLNRAPSYAMRGARHLPSKSLTMLQQLFAGTTGSNDIPLANLRKARRTSMMPQDPNEEETERHLEILAGVNHEVVSAEDYNDVVFERRAQKADFIRDHPTYDKTFWVFSQKNSLRRLCQTVVRPANGERIFGTPPSDIAHPLFQLIILLAVIGGIITEGIATPLYRRDYYMTYGLVRGAWFNIAETTFGLILVLEFFIKIVADGLVFTPNAYVRSIWNILDFLILTGVLVNVAFTLAFIGGLSRFVHALKALRALRLITLIDKMRSTFESLILSGVIRILDAAVLAILYLIPFSVWGTNIFAGLMNECNDTSSGIIGINDCMNEYVNTIYGDSFGYLVPRAWDNPSPSTTFSFDNFRASLLILFEIVSLEGWIDVMSVAMGITGVNQQPQTNASQVNAIFFVIYNLLGGVVILTLFIRHYVISIIIGNFSSKTGTAFLTQPQREWIDLQKLIKRQRPSKRPETRPILPLRAWCYDRAIHKHGWWSRMMTLLFFVQILALMWVWMTLSKAINDLIALRRTQTFTTQDFSLLITSMYVIDITVRFYGLGWRSFRANGWNIFDVIVAGGSFVTTLVVRFGDTSFDVQQLQKLFLVSIAFKLVQRTNSLNQLFKTGMASMPVILSLLGLWLVLFLFFAIMYMEVFGMAKWNSAETRMQNYQTMGSALLMLAFMSTGEGWNQYMHDYALTYPRCTRVASKVHQTDCGSVAWAFSLFIAWNLLSMYIFLNMFTGVVVENFSYVFQSSGGAKSINREEMRSFKKVWAEYANPKTGYLERSRIVPFLAKLGGVFESRIYPADYSAKSVAAACRDPAWAKRDSEGLNINKMNKTLDEIDYAAIRRRRNIYSRLYHEASISHHKGRGISFTDMLTLLAHHKLIVDRDALVLKDLVVRTETNRLVTDLVNLDRVRSLLKMITLRRRYLAQKEQTNMGGGWSQSADIPEIYVDSMPATPPPLIQTRDITSPRSDYARSEPDSASPSPSPRIFHPAPEMLAIDTSFRTSLQRARRVSDVSMLSADMGHGFWRDSSPELDYHGDVVASVQNSIWGDMMAQAAEEEDDV